LPEYTRVQAIIDLDAVASNTKSVKGRIKSPSLIAVVKADGYGHGAAELSKVMLQNGADSLAVAICEEGIALRERGIHAPILILGYTPSGLFDYIANYNLTQTVFHTAMAKELSKIAAADNTVAKIHIKIDTGMSRLGFMPTKETVGEIKEILSLKNIYVEGIYTHFATSDEEGSPFVYEQLERFNNFLALLKGEGINIDVIHAANSGAIVNYPDVSFNASRAGITLCGLAPANLLPLKGLNLTPAMSLKSKISYVKTVGENVSVSYARTFYTSKQSQIATVPVGYADGYPRNLSNKAKVIVRGEFVPVVGNICMDQMMLDVTAIDGVREGDEVVLMGSQGDKKITADDIAEILKTINYEIVCNIGKRVPRSYTKGGVLIKEINHILR
jgi:alanine racemase